MKENLLLLNKLSEPQRTKCIYIYFFNIKKNVCIDKLDDRVSKYNKTYHNKIKIKSVDVKSSTYIDSSKEINDKNP